MGALDSKDGGYRISKSTGNSLIIAGAVLDIMLPFLNFIPIFGSLVSGAVSLRLISFFWSKGIRSSSFFLLLFEAVPILNIVTGFLPMFSVSIALAVSRSRKQDEKRMREGKGNRGEQQRRAA